MPKKRCYAVAIGRETGVYSTWEECRQRVTGFSGARYMGFASMADAQRWLDEQAGWGR